ncbi:MAG: alcohol dehydrogenase [Acidobacteria bacterium RIFCSPLOWO2_02_FULL_68_18]|nr:MAG: alcohol dehydrogenase [Acidobacteria bacterium RIFCSPLOWO2_02_FULL_68_18]OFW51018.1 MAG: alcohol dehydrogenase [Acidobacteria bacterium RIFCSPLOWO2_12_FULL_68_19]
MKAVVLRALGEPEVLRIEEAPDPQPERGEAVVRLRAAALNHRDVWIRTGRYAGITLPVILGSDGAGEVVETGADVDPAWRGRAVVIDPTFNWGDDERAQGPAFQILGLPGDGTYADLVRVPADALHDKPPHLSFEEAAAVPLASVTAYRALVTRGRIAAGETVVVTGIGGGVATCALLIGARLGAKVYVTSGSDAKLDTARRHGAAGGVSYHDPEWPKALVAQIGGRPDVVVDGAGGDTFNKALDLVTPGGRVVSYGATLGPVQNLEVRRIFWKQLNVLGSTMGTRRDFAAMLRLYADGLRPIVDTVLPLDQAAQAHRRMEEGRQFGKIVLRI